MLCVGNKSCDVGTGAGRQKSLDSGVSQGTPNMPRYNRAIAMRPLLLTKIVLPCIKLPNDGLTPVGRLGQTMRNGGPMARYCSLANLDLGRGEMGLLLYVV